MSFKISKISLNPSRKINLGNYSTADLNAGIEIVFDTPVPSDSPEVKEAFDKGRAIVMNEFKLQYEPYRKTISIKKKEKQDGD